MKKITLYMETATKTPEQTMGEIQQLLKGYGLKKFMADYKNGEIVGCMFSIDKDGTEIPFRLPIKWRSLWNMAKQGRTRYIRNEEQAKRVAWRQVYRWIEAQLALVCVDMVGMVEVFLPYMATGPELDQTFYQKLEQSKFKGILPDTQENR